MKEARVTCLCTHIELPDVGLVLEKGQVAVLPEEQARRSADLRRAVQHYGVRVAYVHRAAVQRQQEGLRVPPPPAGQFRPVAAPAALDPEVLADRIAAGVERRIAQTLDALRPLLAGYVGQPPAAVPPFLAGMVSEEVPVFIPTVKSDLGMKADITVAEAAQEGQGVAEAAKALRKAKKGRAT